MNLKDMAGHYRGLAQGCRDAARTLEGDLEKDTHPTRFLPRSFPTIRAVARAGQTAALVRSRVLREEADAYDDIAAVYESAEWAP